MKDAKDIVLRISEDCAIQMMEMAIELYKEKPEDPTKIAKMIIDGTKEMISRGNICDGIIVGSEEKATGI